MPVGTGAVVFQSESSVPAALADRDYANVCGGRIRVSEWDARTPEPVPPHGLAISWAADKCASDNPAAEKAGLARDPRRLAQPSAALAPPVPKPEPMPPPAPAPAPAASRVLPAAWARALETRAQEAVTVGGSSDSSDDSDEDDEPLTERATQIRASLVKSSEPARATAVPGRSTYNSSLTDVSTSTNASSGRAAASHATGEAPAFTAALVRAADALSSEQKREVFEALDAVLAQAKGSDDDSSRVSMRRTIHGWVVEAKTRNAGLKTSKHIDFHVYPVDSTTAGAKGPSKAS